MHILNLKPKNLKNLLLSLEKHLHKDGKIIEKDLGICHILQQIYELPESERFAFKGGTSLSKAFNIIDRFSEDIDITIDYKHLDNSIDLSSSKSQLKNKQNI